MNEIKKEDILRLEGLSFAMLDQIETAYHKSQEQNILAVQQCQNLLKNLTGGKNNGNSN